MTDVAQDLKSAWGNVGMLTLTLVLLHLSIAIARAPINWDARDASGYNILLGNPTSVPWDVASLSFFTMAAICGAGSALFQVGQEVAPDMSCTSNGGNTVAGSMWRATLFLFSMLFLTMSIVTGLYTEFDGLTTRIGYEFNYPGNFNSSNRNVNNTFNPTSINSAVGYSDLTMNAAFAFCIVSFFFWILSVMRQWVLSVDDLRTPAFYMLGSMIIATGCANKDLLYIANTGVSPTGGQYATQKTYAGFIGMIFAGFYASAAASYLATYFYCYFFVDVNKDTVSWVSYSVEGGRAFFTGSRPH